MNTLLVAGFCREKVLITIFVFSYGVILATKALNISLLSQPVSVNFYECR